MSKRIRLSEKYGVNPTMLVCPVCGNETGEIALLGKLKGDKEAPKYMYGNHPCDECKKKFDEGYVALVEAIQKLEGMERTGRMAFVRRVCLNPGTLDDKCNMAYCDKGTMDKLMKLSNQTNNDE